MTLKSLKKDTVLDAASGGVNVQALMKEIRSRVEARVQSEGSRSQPFTPYQASSDSPQSKAGEIVHSEELRFLNRQHTYPLQRPKPESFRSHRPILGRIIAPIKRKISALLWDSFLKEYFEAERDYNANLVRLLNNFSRYVDARDASNFWELIRKIDYDLNKALTRIERINDDQSASLRTAERNMFDSLSASENELNKHVGDLLTSKGSVAARLDVLESVTRGLEELAARASKSSGISQEKNAYMDRPTSDSSAPSDPSYLLFENRFRGKEELIKERISFYPSLFGTPKLPVLEIGSGRGELQAAFKESGIPSYGVELDAGMAEHAKAKGFDVRVEDGLVHLAALPDRSLSGVIALQVIEHLELHQLRRLCELARQKVIPGGKLVLETINSASIVALTQHYFRDPTHVFPLHPDTARFIVELSGLRVVEVRKLSPFPKEAQFQPIAKDDFMTPRWALAVDRLNENFNKLNDLFYGYQDYCLVAEVTPG